MRKPEAAVAAIWRRWEAEEITLDELRRQLWASGWSRRQIYAALEREAEAPRNRPDSSRLQN
jgi:hypothetical protein